VADHNPVVLRTFDPDDHAAISAIVERTFDAGELPGRTRQDVRRFLDVLPGDPAGTLVVLVGGEVVGFATPFQQQLIVHPAHRRRGHGTRLVEAALAAARANEEPKLTLAPPPAATPPPAS